MDLAVIERFWDKHPAWRLLRTTNAPLVLSFLGHHFVEESNGATPAFERAYAWVSSLQVRAFIGTESRPADLRLPCRPLSTCYARSRTALRTIPLHA